MSGIADTFSAAEVRNVGFCPLAIDGMWIEAGCRVPNDEPTTRYATRRLAVELRAAGHEALAARVDAGFEARMRTLEAAFGDGTTIFDPANVLDAY